MRTKILFLLLGLSIVHSHVLGQGTTSVSKTQNYVLTATPRVATSNATTLTTDNSLRTVQYYDGLGRPNQTIQIGTNPDKYDLATYQLYDDYGRERESWLPVAASGNNGAFIPFNDAFRKIANESTYPNDPKPYTQIHYENSPLNRVSQEYGPGVDWQNNGKSVKTEYLTNIGTLACRLYTFIGTASSIKFNANGNYAANQLYVTKTSDEDGKNITYEFKDKLGQVVLTRQMNEGKSHDTYYVYDDFGNLRVVIPPMLADKLTTHATGWTDTTADVANYAYLYKYDDRNRCIGKKLPGADWITYVYDKADRLIFSQDGQQKKSGIWRFSFPDALGREVVTGTFNTLKIGTTNKTITPGCLDGVVVTAVFDKAKGTLKGYTTAGITLGTYAVLTASYYDNYEFMGSNGIPASKNTHIKYEAVSGFGTQHTGSFKGLLTGTITANLEDTSKILYSVMYYDYRGRVIQIKSNNHLNEFTGGYEKEYIAYNFAGQPTKRRHIHIAGETTQTEEYVYTYDHAGRLKQTTHKLNSGTAVVLASNTYDKVGRLASSKKGNLPKTEYTYNIRSWVKRIYTPNLFDENLYYNETHLRNTPMYNGNINTMTWRIRAPHLAGERGYNFEYDDLSRLKVANYQYNDRINIWDYYMFSRYDKNGNIEGFYRRGKGDNGWEFPVVDITNMYYSGNQLIKLDDSGVDVKSKQSGDIKDYKDETIEYTYNENGAMTKDLNKGVTYIKYNLLNLPSELGISNRLGKGSNKYIYAADGTKLQVQCLDSIKNTITKTDYVGNKVYEKGSLKRILVDGGYISMPDKTYYHYLTDHLGSVRLTVKSNDATIAQEMDYYPFGMVCGQLSEADQSFQPYKYNGKEMDRIAGLNVYDYGARYMDPAIGRFTTMDRYCEKYYNLSPYQFAANNPINNLEINGDSVWFSVNRDSHNKITEITMNVTGKVLNDSNNNINMKGAINTISGAIRGAFKGKVDGAKFSTNINLEKAANMNEVKDGDHLFVLTDKISQLKGDAEIYGAANMDGGKVAFIDADYFVGPYDELIGSMGEGGRTAAHEFGHLLGLKHTNNIFNLMRSNGAFRNISGNQLNQIYNMRTNQLNRGSNYELNLRGQKRPNRGNRDASIYIRP